MRQPATRILFIENSIGLGGSTVSLCTLLSALSPGYRAAVALSRPVQERYLRERLNPVPPLATIACRPVLRTSSMVASMVARVESRSVKGARLISAVVSGLDLPFVIAPYVWQLRRFARRVGVDVIQHNNGFDFAAVLLKRVLGVPLIAYQRGWEFDSFTMRRLGNWVDCYVANSETTRTHLTDLGIEPARIEVVYPPVDLARFHPAVDCVAQRRELAVRDDEACFGVIGALTEYRGHRTFLRAAAIVLRALPRGRAFVIGEAPAGEEWYKEELLALAAELGISERVLFMGYRADIPNLMQMLDVVVHTADFSEPFGRAIAEAMAMGKPVVATIGGGPCELIQDGETGCLVPQNDADALARRVLECLADLPLARRLGARAHEHAIARFGTATHATRMQEIYDRVVPYASTDSGDAVVDTDVAVSRYTRRRRPEITGRH